MNSNCESNSVSKKDMSLLSACLAGNLDLVKYLIANGADPNFTSSEGISLIQYCCTKKASLPILLYFFNHPVYEVDVNHEHDGKTNLMLASSAGLYRTVKVLLERGAEVNRSDLKGRSAIFYAAKGCFISVITLLLSHGACINLQDNDNANILHRLLMESDAPKKKYIRQTLEFLVERTSVNINLKMNDGTTPLHKACESGLVRIAKYLILKGANLEAKKDFWKTPLWSHLLSLNPKPEMIMLLYKYKANFEQKNPLGMTVFDYLVKILKNDELIEAYKEIQKAARRRKIDEMIAKRKALLFCHVEKRNSAVLSPDSPDLTESPPAKPRRRGKLSSEERHRRRHEVKSVIIKQEYPSEDQQNPNSSESSRNFSECVDDNDMVDGYFQSYPLINVSDSGTKNYNHFEMSTTTVITAKPKKGVVTATHLKNNQDKPFPKKRNVDDARLAESWFPYQGNTIGKKSKQYREKKIENNDKNVIIITLSDSE